MISHLTLIAVRILKINVKMFEKQTVHTVSTVNIINYRLPPKQRAVN